MLFLVSVCKKHKANMVLKKRYFMALHKFEFIRAFHYMVTGGRFLLACEECAYYLTQNRVCMLQRNCNTLVRGHTGGLKALNGRTVQVKAGWP